ncbi:bacteriocin immunity protein [Salmonella enterica subsp. enterica serovar Muenchen]|nr:bacteriocin immunity protein [Salmonella enterica subsp. enterica serovar Muenchen]
MQPCLLFLSDFFKGSRKIILKGEALYDYLTKLSNHFNKITEHPEKIDLIFYPEDNSKCTAEGLLVTVLNWRKAQSRPFFRDS